MSKEESLYDRWNRKVFGFRRNDARDVAVTLSSLGNEMQNQTVLCDCNRTVMGLQAWNAVSQGHRRQSIMNREHVPLKVFGKAPINLSVPRSQEMVICNSRPIFSARKVVLRPRTHKIVCGWGSASDPSRGAYDTSPVPPVGWGTTSFVSINS